MDDWQKETHKFLRLCTGLFGDIAGIALVAMMLMTVYDILARSTGLGSFEPVVELTTMGVVVVASFGLAITTLRGGHVIIDLFTRRNHSRTNRIIDALWLLVMAAMLVLMGWLSVAEGLTLHDYNAVTEILEWSVLAYYLPPAAGWGLAAAVAAWISVTVLIKALRRKPG